VNRSDRRRHLRGVTSRAVIAGLAVSAAGMALAPGVSHASSHREAPLTAADPDIDNTDMYAFNSPDKPNSVTLIANVKPFQLPAGGPSSTRSRRRMTSGTTSTLTPTVTPSPT